MVSNRIHLLEPRLANQIAAGEVIERPASVVKELVENSLDAQATRLEIDIAKGGLQLIRIRDDGVGIHPEDLPLALSRHATSKVHSLTDLEQLTSLGFRGEALASICSVSRFILTSCASDQTAGWSVSVEGRDLTPSIIPAAHPQGTTVEVNDLFFNTPARRKFLRSEQTEWQHIAEVVNRIALSRYEVGFTLTHQQRVIYQLRAAEHESARERRVQEICGAAFIKHALALDIESCDLRLWGWVGQAEHAPTQPNPQFFYVNGRVVRDKLLTHAVRQAYADTLPPGRHPVYVLYLEVDPTVVDVNVHPTKHEVRFRDTRLVHDFIFRSLQKIIISTLAAIQPSHTASREQAYSIAPKLYPAQVNEQVAVYKALHGNVSTTMPSKATTALGTLLGQLHQDYLLLQTSAGLGVIYLPLAHELITYKFLQASLRQTGIRSQPLLVPIAIPVSSAEASLLETHQSQLQQCGIEISRLDKEKSIIRAIPALLRNANIILLVEAVIGTLNRYQGQELLINELLKTLSSSSLQTPSDLGPQEIAELLSLIENDADIRQKALSELKLIEIENRFQLVD